MVLQDVLSAVDAAKQFYKIIQSENNFNRFYDKTVTTAEEYNIDLPESPHYLRLQIKNKSQPNVFTFVKAYFDLLHCELKDLFNEYIPSVLAIEKP